MQSNMPLDPLIGCDNLLQIPSKNLLDQFQNSIPLKDEDIKRCALYLFIKGIIVFFDNLRFEAENEAKERKKEFYYAIRSVLPLYWPRILELSKEQKGAPMGLIVQISQKYRENLLQLAEAPRRILRRKREKVHLSRIQQIDRIGLQWLIKQPGHNPIEKAGEKQEILAVVREESINTLENRVLKSFLTLICKDASEYIYQNKKEYKESSRYKNVRKLQQETQAFLKSSEYQTLTSLHSIPQPNYVLRFDRKYYEMWGYYLRIMKQQKSVECAWAWQEILITQYLRTLLTIALYYLAGDMPVFQHNFFIAVDHTQGRYLSDWDWPSHFWLKKHEKQNLIQLMVTTLNLPQLGQFCTLAYSDLKTQQKTVVPAFLFHISKGKPIDEYQDIYDNMVKKLKGLKYSNITKMGAIIFMTCFQDIDDFHIQKHPLFEVQFINMQNHSIDKCISSMWNMMERFL